MASMACKICKQLCCQMLQAFFLKAMEVADLHTTGLLHDRSRSDQPNLPQVCENLRRTASKKGYFYVQHCPTDFTGTLEQPKAL